MVQFLLKLLLKQEILAVYHIFHWLLIATKLLTAKFHWCYVKKWVSKSEILESESDILPPTAQPWVTALIVKNYQINLLK